MRQRLLFQTRAVRVMGDWSAKWLWLPVRSEWWVEGKSDSQFKCSGKFPPFGTRILIFLTGHKWLPIYRLTGNTDMIWNRPSTLTARVCPLLMKLTSALLNVWVWVSTLWLWYERHYISLITVQYHTAIIDVLKLLLFKIMQYYPLRIAAIAIVHCQWHCYLFTTFRFDF